MISINKRLIMMASILAISCNLMAAREIDEKDFSGWMTEYSDLSIDEERNLFMYMKEEAKGKYKKILVKSVSVYATANVESSEIAQQSAEYLKSGIKEMLKGKGLLTDQPGEGVLELSLAITGTEKSKEDIKVRNFIPVAAVFRVGQAATGKVSTYIDAMMEAEMVDSVSRNRVAAVVAKTIEESEKKSGDELSFSDISPALDTWLLRYEGTISELISK